MVQQNEPFVDYYAMLHCSPDAKTAELKRAYFEQLRKFHPDHRPASTTNVGTRVTQSLNEGWAILQDPARRAAYDSMWKAHHTQAACTKTATVSTRRPSRTNDTDELRRQGNVLYAEGKALAKKKDARSSALYREALAKYIDASKLAPADHRAWSNRALCWLALRNWEKCVADAVRAIELKPDYVKAWIIHVKAAWRGQNLDVGLEVLRKAKKCLPATSELITLEMQMEQASQVPSHGQPRNESENQPESTRSQARVPSKASCGGAEAANRSARRIKSEKFRATMKVEPSCIPMPEAPALHRCRAPNRKGPHTPKLSRGRSWSLPDIGRTVEIGAPVLPWKGHALCTCDFVQAQSDDTGEHCAFCVLCNNALARRRRGATDVS